MTIFWKRWFEPRPFNSGYLPEDGGHRVFFSEYGNPKGKPIVVLHGGPGGGAYPRHAAFANLKKHRVILFDQRGCHKSLPLGRLENNDTKNLLKDLTHLINHLNIQDKIILRGSSWGSALALLYAEKHPDKVSKLLLSQIFLVDLGTSWWEFEGVRWHYPEFVDELEGKAKGDIPAFFAAEINSNNKKKQLDAANYYGWYERVCCSLNPQWNDQSELNEEQLAGLRIFMHYRAHDFFVSQPDPIMENIKKIKNIPTVIVHNRLDFVCPVRGAYELHKALPKSKLIIVPERGHVGRLLYKTINKTFAEELRD